MFITDLPNIIKLLFSREKELYLLYKNILGFYPVDLSYYQTALLHKSSSIRSEKGYLINNERLEFLGDSILQSAVSDILYKRFEDKEEGFLTTLRSHIVKRETLNRLAYKTGLDKLIKASVPLSQKTSVPGNTFEAFIGAIYLDRGYNMCLWFVEKRIIDRFFDLEKMSLDNIDAKSKLIEWGQQHKVPVRFDIVSSHIDGENNSLFETFVFIGDIKAGKGVGVSKKKSHQAAAKATFKLMNDVFFMQKLSEYEERIRREEEKKQEDLLSANSQNTLPFESPE